MKALIYNENSDKKIELVEIEKPKIIKDTDVILKVTLSSICTSDIHIKKGFVPRAVNGVVLGHEFVGVIDEVGSSVKNLKIGDRVAVNCETFCNECYFCKCGFVNNCINGGWELGCRINGAQAEFVRIPYADNTLYKLPKNVSDRNALFVGDILSSGYFAALMLDIKKEDTIGIIGAGPVGMCAMISAKILGVKKIVAIDINEKRLEIAKNKGLADYFINPDKVDIEKEIKKITPYGLDGVIEAAGGKDTFNMAIQIARPNSTIGVVAMYEENQIFPLPNCYGKNLTYKTGGVDAIHCEKLIELISENKINTDFLITKSYKLENILEAYEYFENSKEDMLKVEITY